MKVALGYDPNAYQMKEAVVQALTALAVDWQDMGGQDPIYANVAIEVATQVAAGVFDRGILICGTGIGMSIAANKVKGAYAALVSNSYAAAKAVTSNNANILCLGAFAIGSGLAPLLVRTFLETRYQPGTPSAEKIARIVRYESPSSPLSDQVREA